MRVTATGNAAAFGAANAPLAGPEQSLKCPRCESTNTKFCYYNNYNLSQPRHFCKDCRRYWTKGGCLRNIPVGGGTRKNTKRHSPASGCAGNVKRPPPSSPSAEVQKSRLFSVPLPPIDDGHRLLDINGSFSSLLSSAPQFGNFLECYNSLDSLPVLRNVARPILEPDLLSSAESSGNEGGSLAIAPQPQALPDNFLSLPSDTGGWVGNWPDLSIYTPATGTSFR